MALSVICTGFLCDFCTEVEEALVAIHSAVLAESLLTTHGDSQDPVNRHLLVALVSKAV